MGTTDAWNGYNDWALELAGLTDAAAVDLSLCWEPLFIRILGADGTPANPREAKDFFKRAKALGRDKGFHVPRIERQFHDLLDAPNEPVEIIAYRRLDRRKRFSGKAKGGGNGHGKDAATTATKDRKRRLRFDILAIGTVIDADSLPQINRVKRRDASVPPALVFGIIDDGIGALHGRTRRTPTRSRLEKLLWLGAQPGANPVQTQAQINAELTRPVARSDYDAYRETTDALYPPRTRHSLARAESHGAHMLDLAAGADPGGALADIPILAVQVAPASFDDTSGTLLNFDILIGLHWLIVETAFLAGRGVPVDLVVNMSLGYTAGPKNGRSFIEQAIARIMTLAEVTLRVNVHLTLPYGNGYSDNVIARSNVDPLTAKGFNLRLHPDDRTPSFLEMRLTDQSPVQDLAQARITITPPRGGLQTPVHQLAPGQQADLKDDRGRLVGRLYHVPPRPLFPGQVEPAMLLLAMAPTVGLRADTDLTCASGQWRIALENCDTQAMDVTAQVQRDDDPSDRNTGARQARLEGAETRIWDPVSRAFDGIDEGAGRVTRRGTNSALSTIPHRRAYSVGGALVRRAAAQLVVEPADYYGAEGADWSGRAPDLSAISERARGAPGIAAAGLSSAGNARLSGSSTACATAARDLVERLRGGQVLPDITHPAAGPRLGQRTITDTPAIRRRP
ncbi:hypothetical protein [Gymnodinialimonas ulvae]|uniref:hypothetical protein n=1 Tax=Gymnodinialimonas ulvae TaxID=3126504 RepID=UPI0030B2F4AD